MLRAGVLYTEDITFDHAPSPQHPPIYSDCLVECIVSGQPEPSVSWRYKGRRVLSRKCINYTDTYILDLDTLVKV